MTRGAIKHKPTAPKRPQNAKGNKSKSEQAEQPFPNPPTWITERDSNSTTPIFFWKPHEAWGFLGQWYPSPIRSPVSTDCVESPDCEQCEAERKRFSSCEQYMMYHKAVTFGDTTMAERILEANSPGQMKALGQKVKGFNDYTWDQVKFDIVVQANLLKFNMEEACEAEDGDGFAYGGTGRQENQKRVRLRDILLSTGTRELIEASALDRIWGIGFSQEDARHHTEDERLTWGKNLLGKALMEVRRRLRVLEGLEAEQLIEELET